MKNLLRKKIPIQRRIFTKLLIVIIIVSIIPLIISNFLIISTYQEVITKYFPKELPLVEQDLTLTYQNVKIQTQLTFLLVLILVIFVSIILNRNLVRPLQNLIKGIRKVSEGNLDIKLKVISRDEIGELTSSFNAMVEDLKKSKTALEEEKASLEIKVKARTRELAELNQTLEEQVKTRTKELQNRINELERFHKLTIGREVKMIELKQEIKKLEEKLENK
ncbi:HAMP domain-containing protein [Candidatus Parcubacteria bacterium]|nr:HAMP domain-containing protein [Candidatus Parcubacteria bacterium]